MNFFRRLLLAGALSLATFSLLAGAYAQNGNNPNDDQQQAAAPQPDDQSGANQADQNQVDPNNDQYGVNDQQEAQGQEQGQMATPAPPPPAGAPGQGPQPGDDSQNPPARAARLEYFTGSVSVQPQGTGDWANAELNRPLTNSDNIWADKDSRAEISVGAGVLQIGAESSLTLTRVDENTVQVQLHQGALNLNVERLYNNEVYEVDTPNQAFTVSQPGDYRFDVDPNADTTHITVWAGQGQAAGNGPAIVLHENEQVTFKGNAIDGEVQAAGEPDSFDDWARSRDGKLDNPQSQSAKYVSPDVPGYQDLDEYGTWRDTPDYGEVWVPGDVAVGWAPYRYGHWIWVAPWGWTWVDDTPWGFAPFHYGRWVYWGGYWGWAPGPLYARPYYAPALVAWFGGPGFGVGFGFGGGYGWCPLGWDEPFIPWYHVDRGYFNRVNVTNIHVTNVQITNIYNNNYLHGRPVMPGGGFSNMRRPNGFTAVSRNTFTRGGQVGRNALRVSSSEMNRMRPVSSLNARPEGAAALGGTRARFTPPARSFARPTVTRAGLQRGGFANVGRPVMANRPASIGHPASPIANRGREPMHPEQRPVIQNERGPMMSRAVPRPPNATVSRGPETRYGNVPRYNERSTPGTTRGEMNVPRPPNATSRYSPEVRRPENSGSYGRPEPSYDRGSYGRPTPTQSPSYGRGSHDRPAPSYGGGASAPSYHPAPTYGGAYGRPAAPSYGGARSAPSYHPAPSYGGGRSAPSYGGGRSYGGGGGGGGHYSGGGGGHAPSGGGHSGGGGGGGAHGRR